MLEHLKVIYNSDRNIFQPRFNIPSNQDCLDQYISIFFGHNLANYLYIAQRIIEMLKYLLQKLIVRNVFYLPIRSKI